MSEPSRNEQQRADRSTLTGKIVCQNPGERDNVLNPGVPLALKPPYVNKLLVQNQGYKLAGGLQRKYCKGAYSFYYLRVAKPSYQVDGGNNVSVGRYFFVKIPAETERK